MKSNLEWERWGERDPLYAVASWVGKERGSPDAWTEAEFYELGRLDWEDFSAHWRQYGVRPGACLEIGCGAGRITKQLSQFFEQVTGVDVSQHQLEYARQRIAAPKVLFVHGDGTRFPVRDAVYEAAFSAHVFQHFESHEDALAVFRDIHRVLKPGGTIMIHLPLYELPDTKVSALLRPAFALVKRASDLKAAVARRKLKKGTWKPVMRRLRFERSTLLAQLEGIGFDALQCRLFPVRSNGSFHEFVFATKAATRFP